MLEDWDSSGILNSKLFKEEFEKEEEEEDEEEEEEEEEEEDEVDIFLLSIRT